MLSKLIEESYNNYLTEALHAGDPWLDKTNPNNNEFRNQMASELKRLRLARDEYRNIGMHKYAHIYDNDARLFSAMGSPGAEKNHLSLKRQIHFDPKNSVTNVFQNNASQLRAIKSSEFNHSTGVPDINPKSTAHKLESRYNI